MMKDERLDRDAAMVVLTSSRNFLKTSSPKTIGENTECTKQNSSKRANGKLNGPSGEIYEGQK
jgi:hypothetical protein